MSIRYVNRAVVRELKRTARLAAIVPQLPAKVQARLVAKTSKHRGQKLS
jgi:hypothetical protein